MPVAEGARVLVVGVGGLGSPVALALAECAAVSALTLVDPDRVELSNLHRQILLRESDLGRAKVLSAQDSLRERSARVASGALRVDVSALRLDRENIDALLDTHDLIVEGSDDIATKFLVNDRACKKRRPAVIGGVVRFAGQLMTVWPGASCYRCLFEAPPPEGAAATCQQVGVLGPACGIVAGLMVQESLRALASAPAYAGAILTVDLLRWRLRRVPISRRSDCSACASGPILDSAAQGP